MTSVPPTPSSVVMVAVLPDSEATELPVVSVIVARAQLSAAAGYTPGVLDMRERAAVV